MSFQTDTWEYEVVRALPQVSSDNYAAISPDGKLLAYTTWDEHGVRRYLIIEEISSNKTQDFFSNMPPDNEIIKISWLPDNETLIYIRNDTRLQWYQTIEALNVRTGESKVLVRGEVWRIRAVAAEEEPVDAWVCPGSGESMPVKFTKPSESGNMWHYYLDHEDLDHIYRAYGGVRTFDYDTILTFMSVIFSAPRVSPDGSKILYSAMLERSSAPGGQTPLWVTAAIWEYDLKTGQSRILHRQEDEASIGRVDWIDNDTICFVTYYEWTGTCNDINLLDISTGEHSVIFPHSDQHYNNVTLLPIGDQKLTFTSSPRDAYFEESVTMLYDVDQQTVEELPIYFEGTPVLLTNFIYE